jgi:hypothetical protein
MSEEQTTQAVVDETKAPAQPGAEATSARNDDASVDALLQEFDRAQPKGEGGQAPAAQETPQPPPGVDWSKARPFSDSDMIGLAMETDRQRIIMDAFLQQHQQQLHQQQERDDFNKIVTMADEFLEGLPVPEDFARKWLTYEYHVDPQLREAWDNRRASHDHDAYASSVIKRALKKLHKEASRIPDAHATEDRAAVVAAMRGASNSPPPAETSAGYAQRLSRMTQKDLEAEWAKHGM